MSDEPCFCLSECFCDPAYGACGEHCEKGVTHDQPLRALSVQTKGQDQ